MSEKNAQLTRTVQTSINEDELRLFPFAIAGLVCFIIAVFLGTGTWYIFGSANGQMVETAAEAQLSSIHPESDDRRARETAPETAPETPAAEETKTTVKPEA